MMQVKDAVKMVQEITNKLPASPQRNYKKHVVKNYNPALEVPSNGLLGQVKRELT